MNQRRPYVVYILWSNAGRCFYIGISENIRRRLTQHNKGESKWTQRYAGTWCLVWQRLCPSLGVARKFENRLKRQKSGVGFFKLTGLDQALFSASGS